ncbi:MAG: hypothetical protein ACRDT6_02560 [Micromonosporaceae bacterium]
MLIAWLLATVGAVGVAWVGVHPVADLGIAERPPVPQPQVANSPTYGGGNDSSDPKAPGGITAAPSASRSKLPSKSPGTPEVTTSPWSPKPSKPPTPSTGPSKPSPDPSGDDTLYRDASSEGGTATFEYASTTSGGEVYVVQAESYPGWEISAYRYTKDWVAVEFTSYGHVSTIHAYLDQGYAYLEVHEQDT